MRGVDSVIVGIGVMTAMVDWMTAMTWMTWMAITITRMTTSVMTMVLDLTTIE